MTFLRMGMGVTLLVSMGAAGVGCANQKKALAPAPDAAPVAVGSDTRASQVVDLIKATRNFEPEFLETHGVLKDDLINLESAATALIHGDATTTEQLRKSFAASLDQTIERADVIAKRSSETAGNKARARDLREKFVAVRKL